jgi:PIN domain nuclease of toxin-antitoxin system
MFLTDTHPLVWYSTNKLSKLSRKAADVFDKADRGESVVHIPTIVLLEAAMLERDGKVKYDGGFERWSSNLLNKSGFLLAEMNPSIIARAIGYNFNNDPSDKIIVATAISIDLPLITKDVAITDSNLVEIYW